jgi:hypothetical protein
MRFKISLLIPKTPLAACESDALAARERKRAVSVNAVGRTKTPDLKTKSPRSSEWKTEGWPGELA